eukprot:9926109-Prorocentrum_lima.AAC.1
MAEAIREMQRKALQRCEFLVLHADGKGKRFTMLYTTVATDLQLHKGTFGHAFARGDGAVP